MKLPINPLLYLISLGSVAGMVMAALLMRDNDAQAKVELGKVRGDIKKLRAVKKSKAQDAGRWNYGHPEFWKEFAQANFIGKIKKAPVEDVKAPDDGAKPAATRVDLSEVLTVIAITHGTDLDSCVVDYKASVEVPEKLKVQPNTSIVGSIPKGRVNRSNTPRMPTESVSSSPPHHLKVGQALWPPYEHVFLKSVGEDASSVVFEFRGGKKNDKGGYDTDEVFKNELGLAEEILKNLRDGRASLKAGGKDSKVAKANDGSASNPSGGYVWKDQPTTFVDRSGNVNISRKDSKWLGSSGSQIFNEDVHMRDYSAGTGKYKVRGIQLRKLSPRVRQFGAQEGDVVISINNQAVKGQAHARRIGRRLYDRGVRAFKVEILRRGERQFLTFHMDKK